MSVYATLRVFDPQGRLPSREQVEAAAARLAYLGFHVLRIGALGVSVEGEPRDFFEVLGVPPPGPEGYSLPVRPEDGQLRRLIDLVEAYPTLEMY